jgi:hypothetical protein
MLNGEKERGQAHILEKLDNGEKWLQRLGSE